MKSFKDDFKAWKSTLSKDEQSLLLKQAQGEFNKKFRKSDEFSQDISADKIASFANVMKKFFDAERDDYKKDKMLKTPDYGFLQRKAAQKSYDFSLKERVIEIDREADRRYMFAMQRIKAAEAKGETFPQASPQQDMYALINNDTASHETLEKTMEFMKKIPADWIADKTKFDEFVKKGVPPIGTPMELFLYRPIADQLSFLVEDFGKKGEYLEQKDALGLIYDTVTTYEQARDAVAKDSKDLKEFFRSQSPMPGKTKADVLKEIWAELPKATGKAVPPLDEEMLAELQKIPAVVEGEYRHSWGTADKLYKSEAIDSFGQKYLLGVFENIEDCHKAFNDWNAEYEKARQDMKGEIQQWGKKEQARMELETAPQERIKKALEEARR